MVSPVEPMRSSTTRPNESIGSSGTNEFVADILNVASRIVGRFEKADTAT